MLKQNALFAAVAVATLALAAPAFAQNPMVGGARCFRTRTSWRTR
jgi:hypothetical protein